MAGFEIRTPSNIRAAVDVIGVVFPSREDAEKAVNLIANDRSMDSRDFLVCETADEPNTTFTDWQNSGW